MERLFEFIKLALVVDVVVGGVNSGALYLVIILSLFYPKLFERLFELIKLTLFADVIVGRTNSGAFYLVIIL